MLSFFHGTALPNSTSTALILRMILKQADVSSILMITIAQNCNTGGIESITTEYVIDFWIG
jgi:hypothetical protein